MVKLRLAFDWAHRISLNALSNEILIINAMATSVDSKIGLIEDVLTYNVVTDEDTEKRILPLDSRHQIGPIKFLNDILIAIGDIFTKKAVIMRNRRHFHFISPPPGELWPSRGHHSIGHIE